VVGAWLMNEALATDSVVDYSGNGNNGTPTGTTVVDGKFTGTKAREFDRTLSEKVTVGDNAALKPDLISVEAWVYIPSSVQSTTMHFIDKRNFGSKHGFLLFHSISSQIGWQVYNGVTYADARATTGYSYDAWTHLIGVFDGIDVIIYVNGDPIDSKDTISGSVVSHDTTDMKFAGNTYLTGRMCQTVEYNAPLTPTEITNLASNFGDPTLEAGKVLVRAWVTSSLEWGTQEQADLTGEEAAAIGIIFAIMALAVCIAIILARRENE
jgi:hypothetical protein